MPIRPLHDYVLIARAEAEAATPAGLIIPDNARERPLRGVVRAAGPGKHSERGERIAMTVKTGDTVLLTKWTGTEVEIDNEKLLIMHEEEILGLVEAS